MKWIVLRHLLLKKLNRGSRELEIIRGLIDNFWLI